MTPFCPEIWATEIEEWQSELYRLALPFRRIDATRGDFIRIGAAMPGFEKEFGEAAPPRFSELFSSALREIFENQPYGIRLRLPLCSLKMRQRRPRILSFDAAIDALMQPNPRVSGMILQSLRQKRSTAVYAFPWRKIPLWAEFRMFIRDGEAVGISQYHHRIVFPQIVEHHDAMISALDKFSQRMADGLHVPSTVADVFVSHKEDGSFGTTLIEINPFLKNSASCLFTMEDGGDFDGTFRFRRDASTVSACALDLNGTLV